MILIKSNHCQKRGKIPSQELNTVQYIIMFEE